LFIVHSKFKKPKFKRADRKTKTKLKIAELTPSPFPLPRGERIEVRGKRKFLYYLIMEERIKK